MSRGNAKTPAARGALHSVWSDPTGSVTLEYAVLFLLVTLGAALAVVALGVPLLHLFRFARLILLAPIP